jgi:beta-glucosidase
MKPFAYKALIKGILASAPVLAAMMAAAAGSLAVAAAHPQAPSAEERAKGLVAKMTLEEKASQLINSAPAIPRLNLPDYQWWSEALHGFAFQPQATNFPEPIGLAATFNAPLIKEISQTISVEGIETSNVMMSAGRGLELGAGRTHWSPNLNIFRDPRWGRGQETYGEDPFLTAQMGVAYISGLQGPDPNAPTITARLVGSRNTTRIQPVHHELAGTSRAGADRGRAIDGAAQE